MTWDTPWKFFQQIYKAASRSILFHRTHFACSVQHEWLYSHSLSAFSCYHQILPYSKNPYPLRIRIILPNEIAVRVQEPQRDSPSDSWVPGCCQVGNYAISQWVWVLAFIQWPMRTMVIWCWKLSHFPTPHFSTDFDSDHGISINSW